MRFASTLTIPVIVGIVNADPPGYYGPSLNATTNSSCPMTTPQYSTTCETSTTIYETTTWYNYTSHAWTETDGTRTYTPTSTSTSFIGPTVTVTFGTTYVYTATVSHQYTGSTVYSTSFINTIVDTMTVIPTAWSTSYGIPPVVTATPTCPYVETPTTTSTIDIFTATTTQTYYYHSVATSPSIVSTTVSGTSTVYVYTGTEYGTLYTWLTTTPVYLTFDSYTYVTTTVPTTTLDAACKPTNMIANVKGVKGVGSDFTAYDPTKLSSFYLDGPKCCNYCLHTEGCAAFIGGHFDCWLKWDGPTNEEFGSKNGTECCGLSAYLYDVGTTDFTANEFVGAGCGYLVSGDGS